MIDLSVFERNSGRTPKSPKGYEVPGLLFDRALAHLLIEWQDQHRLKPLTLKALEALMKGTRKKR